MEWLSIRTDGEVALLQDYRGRSNSNEMMVALGTMVPLSSLTYDRGEQ